MTSEPTYWDKSSYRIMAEQLEGLLGKEKQLQAIAAAPRCEHGNVYEHMRPTGEWKGVGPSQDDWCEGAPKLADLLDALTKEDKT